jgi:gluconolactonase
VLKFHGDHRSATVQGLNPCPFSVTAKRADAIASGTMSNTINPSWQIRTSLSFSLLTLLPIAVSAADFDIKNEAEFGKVISSGAKLEKLASDMGFVEGPTWDPAGFLIFSDIPNNELKKWTKEGGVTTFRKPSNNANGNTINLRGLLVTAEHSGRRISITRADGQVETLADQYNGKKFNSPNDVVVKRDATIWFTDPDYGLGNNPKEQEGNYVFRLVPRAKDIRPVAKDFDKPNGLCFSPDESKLYIADSGAPKHIRVFEVRPDGSLANGRVFCKIDKGGPDGIRCDADGRIWSSAGDGIHIFGQDGALIGKILVPETPANLCFGGPDGKTVYITARKSLYSIPTLVTGAKRPLKLR